ncbi:MAG: histidine phosphatase family protein [Gammaproteobacteria bacterium]|nr:MAG: histidine phosphatase family protein [Gammaproteobacteria bacterium]TLY86497.1 MAG: histidine phosphatase family protein [Gammaproteobacteria bacterium]
MKRLTLMRHADARWNDPAITDLERPLNRRGTAAAQAMARRLLDLELVPDLLLASPARRTQQTADIVARELSLPARRVRREEALYLASASDMLELVHGTGPRVAHLLLVAHNPGVSELAQLLLRQHSTAGLATAALCSIAFDAAHWAAIDSAAVTDVQREKPPARLFGLLG